MFCFIGEIQMEGGPYASHAVWRFPTFKGEM